MSSSIPPSTPGRPWQPPTPEDLQPELPQYEISGLLGRGGMGAVYPARQKSLKREVAIKVLPPMTDDGGMQFAERFKTEAESMARLNHPGIVAVHDAGETPGGLLYIVSRTNGDRFAIPKPGTNGDRFAIPKPGSNPILHPFGEAFPPEQASTIFN